MNELSEHFRGPVVLTGGMTDLRELDDSACREVSGFGSFFVFSGKRRGTNFIS